MIRILSLFLFTTLIASGTFGQKNSNRSRNFSSTSPIFDGLNYHRDKFNADSALYYADELVKFQKKNSNEGGIVSAYFQKINTLNQFNKESEGFKLALTVYDEYCGENEKEGHCVSCGYIYEKLADYMATMQDYRQGINYLKQSCTSSSMINYKIAGFYAHLNLPDSALIMTSESITEAKKLAPHEMVGAYNAHGLIAQRLNRLDEAIDAYSRAIKISDSLNHPVDKYAFIMGNLGLCYFKKGDSDLAYKYLLIDCEGSLKRDQVGSYINAALILIEIDLQRKDYVEAKQKISSILSNYNNQLLDDQRLTLYELLIQISKSTGNDSDYDRYSAEWMELSKKAFQDKVETHKSLVQQYSANSLRQAQYQLETEKELSAQEMLVLEKEQEKNQLRNWLVIIGLTLILLILFFFFLRWRSIARVKETQLKLSQKEQDFLELKVESESKNVQALSLELSVKKDFSKSLVDKLKDFENVSKSDVKNIEIFIQNELDIKSTRADLQNQMGDLSSEFYNKLNITYPHLTELDVKLAAMVVMNMSNKDIAISKNITPGSVRIAKNRLKKKLNLPEETDLTAHLKAIL